MGLGPFFVSTSLRGRRLNKKEEERRAKVWGALFGVVIVSGFLGWPYLLGDYRGDGTIDFSGVSTAAWVGQVAWIVVLVTSFVGYAWLQVRREQAEDEELAEFHASEVEIGRRVLAAFADRSSAGVSSSPMPFGLHGRKAESLLDQFQEVSLVQPRVLRRGEPASLTPVDHGAAYVTTERVLFVGSSKTLTWEFSKLVAATPFPAQCVLAMATSNRQAVSGVLADTIADFVALRLAVAWGLAEWNCEPATYEAELNQARVDLTAA